MKKNKLKAGIVFQILAACFLLISIILYALPFELILFGRVLSPEIRLLSFILFIFMEMLFFAYVAAAKNIIISIIPYLLCHVFALFLTVLLGFSLLASDTSKIYYFDNLDKGILVETRSSLPDRNNIIYETDRYGITAKRIASIEGSISTPYKVSESCVCIDGICLEYKDGHFYEVTEY